MLYLFFQILRPFKELFVRANTGRFSREFRAAIGFPKMLADLICTLINTFVPPQKWTFPCYESLR